MDNELPKFKKSNTETPEPKTAHPRVETELPSRAKDRTDNVLAK
jgi:hypothetical protein